MTSIRKATRGITTSLVFTAIFLAVNHFVIAQQDHETYSDSVHVANMYANASLRVAFNGRTREEFEVWQKAFRPELKKVLRLEIVERQLAEYQPLAKFISAEDIGFAIRERWHIFTEPTVRLPFILLKPKKPARDAGLVIAPHGHSKNTELYEGNEGHRYYRDGVWPFVKKLTNW